MSKSVRTEYNTEFKDRAVNMVIRSDKSIAQIARDLGVIKSTLYAWVNKAKVSKIEDNELTAEELFTELKRVKNELAEVKEQRDILKKATAYFAKENL